jgi:hypothetical protein
MTHCLIWCLISWFLSSIYRTLPLPLTNKTSEHTTISNYNQVEIAMNHSTSAPYLTATLSVPQTELDLSSTTPFSLTITVTLHASSPILCYIADTFLHPQTALRKPGICFTKLDCHRQGVQRSTVHINTGNSTTRPWDPTHFLLLQPEEPVCIDIPFGSLKPGTAAFDIRLWITTSGFETGDGYEAVLPIGGMVSWWR